MGITVFYHSPLGSVDNENWVFLHPLQTEGYKYSRFQIATPLGWGITMTHNRYTRFGLVFNYTKTFTDYIDDISNYYADPTTLSEAGAALANQSDGIVPETDKYSFMAGERRGDPTDDDVYMTLSFTYSKYLIGQNKYYRNVAPRRNYHRYSRKNFKTRKSNIIRAKF